jgi:glucose/arabinose dehydrogenase
MRGSHDQKVTKFVFWFIAVLIILIIVIFSNKLVAQNLPAGFSQVRVANGITNPTVMAFAPDGRIFVCEQGGNLRVIKNEVLLPTPFISIPVNTSGERGLIGVVLDPGFSTNGYVYLYHTLLDGSRNRISRVTANGDVALAGSGQVVLDLDPLSADIHNGGAMHFGPDGKLYVAVGENGVGANSQNLNTYFGKILRINPDGSTPDGNPFTDGSEQRRRIWSYGSRNPYTFDFQPGTGKFYINDVGAMSWEEINDGTVGGLNFGWPANEGIVTGTPYTNPIYAYGHGTTDGLGCAITGGVFFNPATTSYPPEYFGKYFFMDLCGRWLNFITPETGATRAPFATNLAGQCLGLEIGPDGNLYYAARQTNSVYKIVYSSSQQPIVTSHPASQSLFEGETANFSVSASGAQPLSYQWRKDGVNIPGANGAEFIILNVNTSDAGQYDVQVSNSFGSVISSNAPLSLLGINNPPEPVITDPVIGSMYRGGDVVLFSGSAADTENGTLPASSLTWQLVFHHAQHVHDSPPMVGVANGSFEIPTIGETSDDVWYRVYLTATDLQGRSSTVYRDVFPYKSQIRMETQPINLQLTLDGQPVSSQHTVMGVEGIEREIGVITPQFVDGTGYEFDHWEHGGDPIQIISTPPEDVVFTAVFREVTVTGFPGGYFENLKVYPNPATDFLILENIGGSTVFLYDLQGRVVGRWSNANHERAFRVTFSISPGIYFMKISNANQIVLKKIIVN